MFIYLSKYFKLILVLLIQRTYYNFLKNILIKEYFNMFNLKVKTIKYVYSFFYIMKLKYFF